MMGAAFLMLGVAWYYFDSKYKMKVIMKDLTAGHPILREYRAKHFIDKDKTQWWKLAGERIKERQLIPVPPEDCVYSNHKGRMYLQCYRFVSGEIVFAKDDWKYNEPPQFELSVEQRIDIESEKDSEIKKIKFDKFKTDFYSLWKKKNNVILPFQPVTTNQRMGYFNNIKKAEERKKFDWKSQLIPIAAIGSITIILIALMLFWGDIAAPALQADQIVAKMQDQQLQMAKILKDIRTGQQTIGDKVGTGPLGQTAPD